MPKKDALTRKDYIIISIVVVGIAANTITTLIQGGFSDFADFLTQTMLIFMSIVGLIEIAHFYNFDFFVPDFILNKEQKNQTLLIKECMEYYYQNETNFLNDYSEDKIGFIISQLGISVEQMDKIRLELIKMRCLPLNSLEDAKKRIYQYIRSGPPMLIDLRKIDAAKRARPDERFFVNFSDPMFFPHYCQEIASTLAVLIKEKTNIQGIDRIVLPYDSNFPLGSKISEKLGKPLVKMRPKHGRYITERCWDGDLRKTDRVIIVHDVLVSGDQILHTLEHLPPTCHVEGLYCLIGRTDAEGLKLLASKQIKVETIMNLDDNDIAKILSQE